jgi:hypothetical protein
MAWQTFLAKGVAAKVEGAYKTDSVPAVATDALRIAGDLWAIVRIRENWPNKRPDAAGSLPFPVKPGLVRGRYIEAEIPWEPRGAGADAVIEADPLMRCSGWTQVDGALKFDYTLGATAHESSSIYFWTGNVLIKAVGCRGSLRFSLAPGRINPWFFLIRGHLGAEEAETALPGGFGYDTTDALSVVSASVAVGAWTPAFSGFEFNQNADPQLSEDGNGSEGLGEFDWADCTPTLRLTARKPPLATYDANAVHKARTSAAINATLGSVAFNRLKLSCPETYLNAPEPASSQGFVDRVLTYDIAGTTPTITSD